MARKLITRQAKTREELEVALSLVHERYVGRGYMEPHPSGLRLSLWNALPSTQCFLAIFEGKITSTVSLFFDSELGLPLDCLYRDRLDDLRSLGRSIAEVGMLTDRREALGRGIRELLLMMRSLFWSAMYEGVDDLVIGVNPRHVAFYKRMLCFEEFGGLRAYPAVRNAPAILLRLNIADLDPEEVTNEGIRKTFFEPLEPEELVPGYRMRAEDLRHFFVEKVDLFSDLDPVKARIIEGFYPGLRIADLVNEPVGGDDGAVAASGSARGSARTRRARTVLR